MGEVITVAEVKWPQPGKKTGSVYDTRGTRWLVWPDQLSNFKQGQSYEIGETKSSVFNGQKYTTIMSYTPITGSRETPQHNVVSPSAFRQAPPPPPKADDRERRRDIFVCGAFNNIMSNPNVNPLVLNKQEVIHLINMLKEAWTNTLSGTPPRDDMNDEIAFNG